MQDILSRLKFRSAKPDDVDFVIECIIEAEKSGTNKINTCGIFNLTEMKWREILRNILLEDIPGYDFSLSGFMLAELDGIPVCAQGAWYSGNVEIDAGLIKTSMFMEYMPEENFNIDPDIFDIVKALTIKRDHGMIQLEFSYTVPRLRRNGIFTRTLIETLRKNYNENPGAKMVQTVLFRDNYKIFNILHRLGFEYTTGKTVSNPRVLDIFAFDTMVKMNLTIGKMKEIISTDQIISSS